MNGRIKKSRVNYSVDFGNPTNMDKMLLLEKQNEELENEISDMHMTLELNKESIMDIIMATWKEDQHKSLVTTINRLVKENINLQNEVQRVQNELGQSFRNNFMNILRDSDTNDINEETKVNMSSMNQSNILEGLKIEDQTIKEVTSQVCQVCGVKYSKSSNSQFGDSKCACKTANNSSASNSSNGSSSSGEGSSHSSPSVELAEKEIQTANVQILAEDVMIADPEEIDKLNENNDIMKELLAEKEKEINSLKQQLESKPKSEIDLNDIVNATDSSKNWDVLEENKQEELENNFRLTKCKEIIIKYQDCFEDLASNYSLPEEIKKEVEIWQENYLELFSANLLNTQNFCLESNTEDEEQNASGPMDTLESYDEPIPVKDPDLKITHLRPNVKIPVLDMSKVQALSSSGDECEEEEEEEEQVDNQQQKKVEVNSISSDGDPEDFLQILDVEDDENDNDYWVEQEDIKNLDNNINGFETPKKPEVALDYELEQNPEMVGDPQVHPEYTSSQDDFSRDESNSSI